MNFNTFTGPVLAALAATGLAACGADAGNQAQLKYEIVATAGANKFVVAPNAKTPEDLTAVAKRACPGSGWCKAMIWASKEEAGTGFPMTDAQAESQLANYTRNPNTGHDQIIVGGVSYGEKGDATKTKPVSFDGSTEHRVSCIRAVKNDLKDPGSFKRLDHSEFRRTGILRYSATNSFGGRVQSVFDCNSLTY